MLLQFTIVPPATTTLPTTSATPTYTTPSSSSYPSVSNIMHRHKPRLARLQPNDNVDGIRGYYVYKTPHDHVVCLLSLFLYQFT
ncbi:hypothetical protein EDB19DRAFT_1747595 [Suillus lakei]|nr:hypothetical protein EDB19DRAFT_1747595 [Suillus lakei]